MHRTGCRNEHATIPWHNKGDEPLVKNFHLPLPEGTYAELRAELENARIPATTIAREAITDWLRMKRKAARRQALMDYASEMAGTRFDFDADLESAAIEQLMKRNESK